MEHRGQGTCWEIFETVSSPHRAVSEARPSDEGCPTFPAISSIARRILPATADGMNVP